MAAFRLSVEPREVEPGRAVPLRFRILGPDGEPVTDLRSLHERDLHLIVVRHDLATFTHLRADRASDGTWHFDLTLPSPGRYRAFADVAPVIGEEVALAADLTATGAWTPQELPAPARTVRHGAYRVQLSGDLAAGTSSELAFIVTKGGERVDLEPYLGARGHLVALRAEDLAYLHVHPIEGQGSEDVRFSVEVPSPGAHRLVLEFMHEGRVRTIAFTMEASRRDVPAGDDRDVVRFVSLVIALSVPLWLVGGGRLPLPMNLPASAVLTPFIPLLAASALTFRTQGLRGVRRLLRRALDHRRIRAKAWYLPAILLMPAVFLASYWVMRLLGMPLPEPRLQPVAIPLLFALFLLPAIGEEVGWTGYAADRIQARRSALATGVILGVVTGLWHAVPNIQQGHSAAWITWKVAESMALRTLFMWLYNNSGRSVFGAILLHDMYNVSWSSFPNDSSHYEPMVTAPIMAVAASVATLLWGAKSLARFRFARRSDP